MGALFHKLGTRATLLTYSTSSGVLLVALLLYIRFKEYHGHRQYEALAQDRDDG